VSRTGCMTRSSTPIRHTAHDAATPRHSVREILAGVLANEGADLSAHETMQRARRQARDFTTLAAEYNTLARAAQEQRFDGMLARSGLGPGLLEEMRQSESYGPLLAALRDAEARGLDVEGAAAQLVAVRSLDQSHDLAAVMHSRVDRLMRTRASNSVAPPNLIAGLVPRALGVSDPDMAQALGERDDAMQRRARELALQALDHGEAWVGGLGTPPIDPAKRQQWIEAVSTIAAYRDRWNIGKDHRPVGQDADVKTIEGIVHRRHARTAAARALMLSNSGRVTSPQIAAESADPDRQLTASVEM